MATSANNAAQLFTYPLNGNALFVMPATNGVKASSFKCVTGSISIKGNVRQLSITDINGNAPTVLEADYIVLTPTTIPELNISTYGGNSALELIIDASGGVGAMICEL